MKGNLTIWPIWLEMQQKNDVDSVDSATVPSGPRQKGGMECL